jgi:F-type H+-transporting ATPase subunit delta
MSQLSEAYAQAFFDLAVEKNDLDEVIQVFSGIEDGLKEHPSFLSHPKLTLKDKAKIFKSVTDHALSLQFLEVLANHDRLSVLQEIIQDLKFYVQKMKHVKTVHVFSRVSLSEPQAKNIEALFKRQGAEAVELKTHIDPTLLGGIRLKYDDKIFDDSVESTYDTLQQMLN